MGRKRTPGALKVQVEEKKPKVVVKNETSEEEESGPEEETEEIESEKVKEVAEEVDDEKDVEEEEVEEEDVEEEEVEEEEEEVEDEEEEEEEGEGDEDEDEEEEEEEVEEEEEEDDESSKKETLRKLLEPLPKDKIIEFLKEAALNDSSIVARLSQAAEVDPAHRKIFVFGLSWDATSEQVLSVFKQYGDIEECKLVTDKVTGKAKGYCFVLFKTRRSARKALKQPQKKIGSRMASCQLASAGPAGSNNNPTAPTADPTGRKIFVANVGSHVNPNALRSHFAKFGEIEEGPLGMDNTTGKFKGFAFFVYKTADGCKKALEEPNKVFNGCQLHCRPAVDGQRGSKNTKNSPLVTSDSPGNLQPNGIGNLAYGYGGLYAPQLMNPAAGIMVRQNPMLVSALNQSTPQSFGVGSYGINALNPSMIANYGSQLGLPGLGAYPNHPQAGHSSAATTSTVAAPRQQPGASFPSYLGH